MKKILILLCLVLPLSIVLSACGEDKKALTVGETINKMLVLIEENKADELLEKYADMREHGAGQVGIPPEKVVELKAALLIAQGLKPSMRENNTRAVFENAAFKRPMKFILLDGAWRLQN